MTFGKCGEQLKTTVLLLDVFVDPTVGKSLGLNLYSTPCPSLLRRNLALWEDEASQSWQGAIVQQLGVSDAHWHTLATGLMCRAHPRCIIGMSMIRSNAYVIYTMPMIHSNAYDILVCSREIPFLVGRHTNMSMFIGGHYNMIIQHM